MATKEEYLKMILDAYDECDDTQVVRSVGPLVVKSGNDWLECAADIPDPVMLWKELFIQGEVCCLFADTNVGKSVLAVQIGKDIARRGRRVLYLDFEMSAKQFELRYRDDYRYYDFPESFLRCELNFQECEGYDVEASVIGLLSEAAKANSCDVIIIDNLTWLTSTAEQGEAASNLMKALLKLKKERGYSILVLAHTPKRPLTNPITQNDLAGSKQLMNFFDAAFSIGKSAKDDRLRYIKQVKARSTGIVYGGENVITCEIEKVDAFLQFTELGNQPEKVHLMEERDSEKEKQTEAVKQLASEGLTEREIAAQLGMARATVHRRLRA